MINARLRRAHLRRLEEASAFKPGFPTNFFASGEIKGLIYGNTLPLIDRHR